MVDDALQAPVLEGLHLRKGLVRSRLSEHGYLQGEVVHGLPVEGRRIAEVRGGCGALHGRNEKGDDTTLKARLDEALRPTQLHKRTSPHTLDAMLTLEDPHLCH